MRRLRPGCPTRGRTRCHPGRALWALGTVLRLPPRAECDVSGAPAPRRATKAGHPGRYALDYSPYRVVRPPMRPLRWLWRRSGLAQLPVEYRLILAVVAIT